ncbi:MAG TPA: GNAT family N-acetyltransferase [Dehalococcoidia bacterium]|nr:GNAT family N-acetyltransferase [Dehalococcoidia bacterium]
MTSHRDGVSIRRAVPADIPRMAELIAGATLPPLFIAEFLDGFAVGERNGDVVGCGGIEMYGTSAVIRSIVVDERMRGTGLGRRLSELLMADARAAGATDLYLFTADAHDFWQHLGFADITFDDWKPEARVNWQFQFLSQNAELVGGGIFTMWRAA